MFTKWKIITLLVTLVVLMTVTSVVSAAPLSGYRIPCPNGGAACTGCQDGGGYFCTSNGTIVNYDTDCHAMGDALVCSNKPICHCMPSGTSDHCCSSHSDC